MTLLRQGHSFSGRERHCAFINTGGAKRFADVSAVSGLDLPEDGTGVGFCDWDGDGDLDLWVSNRSGPQVRFIENQRQWAGRSVRLRLVGTSCNRDAIGARVELRPHSGAPIIKTLRAGEGYLAQSSKWLHFGLGTQGKIDTMTVRWPGGGLEKFGGVEGVGAYTLEQGTGTAMEWPPPQSSPLPAAPTQPAHKDTASIVLGIPLPLPVLDYQTFAGDRAPLFSAALQNKRGLLINLWATWCAPCIAELDLLKKAKPQLDAAGLGVLALSVDALDGGEAGATAAAKKLAASTFPFPGGLATSTLVELLQIANDELLVAQRPLPVPVSFLVDHNWRLVAIYKGAVDPAEVVAELERLALPFDERRAGTLPFAGRWHFAPKNFVMLNFADRLFQRGRFDAGIDYLGRYARFLEPQPLFPKVLANAGSRCAAQSRDADAAELFRWALKLDPHQVPALNGLARLLTENLVLQNLDEALTLARKANGYTRSQSPEVLFTLALCHRERGELERAREAAELALALPKTAGDPTLHARIQGLRSDLQEPRLGK